MRTNRQRFQDVLDAIADIEKYSVQGREAFESDELIQTWVVHHLQIIGEAMNSVSNEIQQRYNEIPWAQIVEMRNIIIHEYFGVELRIIWDTVAQDLPHLKAKIQTILDELEERSCCAF